MKNSKDSNQSFARSLQNLIVFSLFVGLLLYGTLTDTLALDRRLYQCYDIAFWQGWLGFQKQGLLEQCGFLMNPAQDLMTISQHRLLYAMLQWGLPSSLVQFVAAQSLGQPYHTLPYHYPLIALLIFSLGRLQILPLSYTINFMLWMLLFAGWIYFVLQHWRSRQAAFAYSLYIVLGGWMTVGGRFDIVPAALTLFAVICAGKKCWNRSFALLALATLAKFYPAILLVPFLLALQRETPGKWYVWRRWLPIGVFVGISVLVMGVSLLLSVAGTLAPLGHFIARPVQWESLSASIFWIASLLWKTPLAYVSSFSSDNVVSPLSTHVTLVMNVVLAVGLLSTWRLQLRGRIDLAMACLLTLLILLVTAKVFSTQYLIWVIPLAAYVGQGNRWWLFPWTLIAFLTNWVLIGLLISWVSPHVTFLSFITSMLLVTIRNFLLLGFTLFTLVSRSLLFHPPSHDKAQNERNEQENNNQQYDMIEDWEVKAENV